MKTAVIFYSLEGNTRYAAQRVAGALDADLIELKPVKAYPDKGFKKFFWGGKAATMKDMPKLEPYDFNGDDHELVILCTPVWAGTFTPPMRTFLSENDISSKKVAVLASSSGGNAEKCIAGLKEAAGVDHLTSQVGLVDPGDKPSEANERALYGFVEELRAAVNS